MRLFTILTMFFMFMLILMSESLVRTCAIDSWEVQTVDTSALGQGNGYCPIEVDSNNSAHIAYTDRTGRYSISVMYASWNGSGWSTQTVDSGAVYDLVLDANNTPHILYGSTTEGLVCASWTGTNWTKKTVEANGAGYGAVAVDSSNQPHVAYISGQLLKYASWTGNNWSIQTVDNCTVGQISFQLSLALNKKDIPYIFYDFTISVSDNGYGAYWHLENLRLARLQNSSWNIQNITQAGGFGNMVLDSKGNPHIIFKLNYPQYTGTNNSTLVYASLDGTTWTMQKVVSNANLATNGATANMGFLALDPQDNPRIVYLGASGLTYASWTSSWLGGAWNIQTINSNSSIAGPPCYLAVDANGNPHISFLTFGPQQDVGGPFATMTCAITIQPQAYICSPILSALFLPLVFVILVIIALMVTIRYVKRKKV